MPRVIVLAPLTGRKYGVNFLWLVVVIGIMRVRRHYGNANLDIAPFFQTLRPDNEPVRMS